MDAPAPHLKPHANGVLLHVKVQPRASRNEIGEPLGNDLRVKVTAPPVDSAANEAVVKLLAKTLGLARGRVQLIRGQTSRQKVFLLQGITVDEVTQLLAKK